MLGSNGVRELSAPRRTHVAVLFADLTGFAELVESVDPEMVYEVVRPIMDEFVGLVNAHEGDIQQVLGDGFMAVFGLRGHSGDEALRAVRAGLALVGAAAGQPPGRLPVHIGIECGEVLVSRSWEPAGFAVWGRAVTIASRLCDLAGPGTIHIGPHTFDLVGRDVAHAPPIRVRLKGTVGRTLVRRVIGHPERTLALAG